MENLRAVGRFIRGVGFYLFGRGLLSFSIMVASAVALATGTGIVLPALAVAAGGTLFKMLSSRRDQRLYEDRMLLLYRDDIAAAFDIPKSAVTRQHLYAVAKENGILSQAIIRSKRETMVDLITSTAAGLVTFGLLYVGLAQTAVVPFLTEYLGKALGGIVSAFSMGIVAGATSLVVHNGLGSVIDAHAGLNKANAHDAILRLHIQVSQGKIVLPEQVFGVVVASDAHLAQEIRMQYGRSYEQLSSKTRSEIMQNYGVSDSMTQLAKAITNRTMRPGSLAFILDAPPPSKARQEIKSEVALAVPRASFVERYASAPRFKQSFVERVNASRADAVGAGKSV